MHPFKDVKKPVIMYGSTPPGRMTVSGGIPEWQGSLYWECIHGPSARSLWVAGKLAGVYGAAAQDGSRITELKPGVPESDTWRWDVGNGSLLLGMVELVEEDIRFIELPRQSQAGGWAPGSLPAKLLETKEALEVVEDDGFAADLYGSLCSVTWINSVTGKEYKGSWLRAGEIVAQMRGRGEIASDFFNNGNEGIIGEEPYEVLESLDWVPHAIDDDAEAKLKQAERLIEICEGRAPGEVPDWYVHSICGLRNGDDLDARLHRAAFAGKVSYAEWAKFWELFELID